MAREGQNGVIFPEGGSVYIVAWNLICDSIGKFGGWNCLISGEVFYAALEPELDVLLLGRGY